jgi:hypothetical protein
MVPFSVPIKILDGYLGCHLTAVVSAVTDTVSIDEFESKLINFTT